MSRILHSLNLDTVGGVESIFGDYLSHPSSADHEHHLMILNRRCHPFFREAVRTRIATTTHAKYFGPFRLPKPFRPKWAARQARLLKSDIQIIYNTLDNQSAWAAAPYARSRIYYERGAAWWSLGDAAAIAGNLALTHRFFCNSMAARRFLEIRFGVDPRLCSVIYNPMRLSPPLVADQASALAGCPPLLPVTGQRSRFRIGMAGRLIAVKGMVIGLHALARLLQRSPDFELVIAGKGPEREMLESVARQLGISHAVTFLGVVNDMRAFYSSLDVFVCPSLREPLGNVAIEANGCGCPVVCTNVDGLPEAIIPGRTGWCITPSLSQTQYFDLGVFGKTLPQLVYDPVGDCLVSPRAICPSHLADSVWTLFESPSVRASLADESVQFSHQRFSMDGYVRHFHELLRSVLESAH